MNQEDRHINLTREIRRVRDIITDGRGFREFDQKEGYIRRVSHETEEKLKLAFSERDSAGLIIINDSFYITPETTNKDIDTLAEYLIIYV